MEPFNNSQTLWLANLCITCVAANVDDFLEVHFAGDYSDLEVSNGDYGQLHKAYTPYDHTDEAIAAFTQKLLQIAEQIATAAEQMQSEEQSRLPLQGIPYQGSVEVRDGENEHIATFLFVAKPGQDHRELAEAIACQWLSSGRPDISDSHYEYLNDDRTSMLDGARQISEDQYYAQTEFLSVITPSDADLAWYRMVSSGAIASLDAEKISTLKYKVPVKIMWQDRTTENCTVYVSNLVELDALNAEVISAMQRFFDSRGKRGAVLIVGSSHIDERCLYNKRGEIVLDLNTDGRYWKVEVDRHSPRNKPYIVYVPFLQIVWDLSEPTAAEEFDSLCSLVKANVDSNVCSITRVLGWFDQEGEAIEQE